MPSGDRLTGGAATALHPGEGGDGPGHVGQAVPAWQWTGTVASSGQPKAPGTSGPTLTRRFWVLAVVGVLLAAGAGIGIGAAIAPGNPIAAAKAAVRKALAAGERAGSYRYAQLSSVDGAPDDIIGYADRTGGRQKITDGSAVSTLLLVHGVVYFKGNESAMVSNLGAPIAVATRDAGKWVSVPASAGVYASLADGITTQSNLSETRSLITATSLSSGPHGTTVVHGKLVVGAGVAPTGTASFVIASTGLPQRIVARGTVDDVATSYTWTFDHWGSTQHIVAPPSPIPYSTLGATPPASPGQAPSGGSGGPGAGATSALAHCAVSTGRTITPAAAM